MRTHMQDLKDVTRETHYENYRALCIQNMTRMVVRERKRRSEDEPTSDDHIRLYSANERCAYSWSLRFITDLPVWFMFISSSLCNRLRDSASDLPMPLMPVDSETERLILEKDEEVIQFCLSH